jgi:hypothetical protein
VKGEILGGANPREAADRKRRNSRGWLTDSQREKNPKAERGVRRAEQFDRTTPRNGKRVMAADGPFGSCAVRLSTRKRKPVGFRWEEKASKGEPQERLSREIGTWIACDESVKGVETPQAAHANGHVRIQGARD